MRRLATRTFGDGVPDRPDYLDVIVLSALIAQQHNVPAGASWVRFSAEMPFYVLFGANPTATIPFSEVTDGTASDYCPDGISPINGAAKISLVARTNGAVTMAFWSA